MAKIELLQKKIDTLTKKNEQLKSRERYLSKECNRLEEKGNQLHDELCELRMENPKIKGALEIANRTIGCRDNRIIHLTGRIEGLEGAFAAIARNIN